MHTGNKIRLVLKSIALAFVCIAAVMVIYIFQHQVLAYDSGVNKPSSQVVSQIYVDNTYVGSVRNVDEFKTYLATIHLGATTNNGGKIYLPDNVNIIKDFDDELGADTMERYEELAEVVPVEADAIKVTIEGGNELIVSDRSVFNEAVAELKEDYRIANNISETEAGLIDPVLVEQNIGFSKVVANTNDILSKEDCLKVIIANVDQESTYHPNPNETISQVADSNNMDVNQLLILNPDITEQTLMTPSLDVTVAPIEPKITFSMLQIIQKEMDIPYEIEYIDDDSSYQGEDTVVQAGVPGRELAQFLVQNKNGEQIIRFKQESTILSTPTKAIILRGTMEKPDRGTGNFIWPNGSRRVSTEFGDDDLFGSYRWHGAMDINDYSGSPIWASDNGVVVEAGYNGSYGYTVVIDHNNGFQTRYAHMLADSITVHVGEIVTQGTTIGQMGSTGLSTGTHLHFEIILNGTKVNPRNYLPAE
ncbi:peptidoglycan DD-metalloendopeptidase family protein [Culicoidibacter larvae]|uniref:M23 family metallopeptidase n=1 Tax=Culicoidibacter larvae TaxID=2579976 RepID=A0A5R8QHH5_9FIRM|nr:M23 family metallopeptidase [Culicoidibacter larvae]TLG77458.1 M23 family metallopeptidase [Culicoidibacter larvae]